MTPQEKEDLKRISRVMRAARKIRGQNQVDVAKQLGISQSALSKFESSSLIPSTSQWFSFCRFVQIDSVQSFSSGTIDNGLAVNPIQATNYPESTFKVPRKYQVHAAMEVRAVKPLMNLFESTLGEEKLERYLKDNKVDSDFFVVLDNQINVQFFIDMAKTLIQSGALNPENLNPEDKTSHGVLQKKYDACTDELELVKRLIENTAFYERNFSYRIDESTSEKLTVTMAPEEHLRRFDYQDSVLGDFLCRYKKNYIQRFGTYNGGKRLDLEESQCHFQGAPNCVYHIRKSL